MPEERDPQELLKVGEVCAILNMSRATLYRTRYFRTRMVKRGKRWTRIPRAAVIAFVAMQGAA